MKKVIQSKAFIAFAFGFVMFILIVLPELIAHNGILIIDGDTRTQDIPFMYHLRNSILNGNLIWDHSTGLGAQFLSSYAYYNLFSPFSLLYLLVPANAVIYAMPYITALKFGIGSMLAYFYIRRFMKDPHFAVIGGVVYMMSSFSSYNLVFHFTDIIALFPIMLIALEQLCREHRRGAFALACALMAYVNYYFFFGQAVFIAIYFFVRCADSQDGFRVKQVGTVLIEAVIGVLIAMPLLLPVAVSLLESSKATATLTPDKMLLYKDIFYYLKIIQSAFMIPDEMMHVSLFPAGDRTYPFGMSGASVASYLPLFSMAGVISYILAHKKSWQTILLSICAVMAMVPVLNQLFSALNSNYYARWYYMPMLIAAMISLKALEEKQSFKVGIITCSSVLAAMIIYRLIVDTNELIPKFSSHAYINDPLTCIHFVATALIIGCLILVCRAKRGKGFIPKLYLFTAVSIYICFGIMVMTLMVHIKLKTEYIGLYSFDIAASAEYDDDTDRITTQGDTVNFNHIWMKDSTNYFNSTHDPGFQRFLTENELNTTTGLYLNICEYTPELSGAVSVKHFYLIEDSDFKDYDHVGNFGDFMVIENPYYIPMGYTYDKMITHEAFEALPDANSKQRVYSQYLVVDDPQLFDDILTLHEGTIETDTETVLNATEQRRAATVSDIRKTTDGYLAHSDFTEEELVFISASYNEGWSAFVNGEPTEIYEVNNGLVGIRVPAGSCEIALKYNVRGFKTGAIIGLAGVAALAGYIFVTKKYSRKK